MFVEPQWFARRADGLHGGSAGGFGDFGGVVGGGFEGVGGAEAGFEEGHVFVGPVGCFEVGGHFGAFCA